MPLVSIIIPCYNVAPFMKKCLDTVCAQTLRDIQIICINDGSGCLLYTSPSPRD